MLARSRFAWVALTCFFLVGLGSGCGARARFDVLRPAMLDASPYGNTFSVKPFAGVDPNAAYRVQQYLESLIVNSQNPSHRLLSAGGGVEVTGDVLEHSYREWVDRDNVTCSRNVQYRDNQGRTQTRTESYACTRYTRHGQARSVVRFLVRLTATGQVIFDRAYEQADGAQTQETDREPGYIDGAGMLAGLVDATVTDFARVILPWPDSVRVDFSDCGHAEGCDEAFASIQAGDLASAEARYTAILGPYDDAAAAPGEEDAEIVADTLFNRGIVRAYTGSYELGMADLQRAIAIRPQEERWAGELARIEALAAEQDQLRAQIEGAAAVAPPQ